VYVTITLLLHDTVSKKPAETTAVVYVLYLYCSTNITFSHSHIAAVMSGNYSYKTCPLI